MVCVEAEVQNILQFDETSSGTIPVRASVEWKWRQSAFVELIIFTIFSFTTEYGSLLVSISPIFYQQHFQTKFFCATFMCLQFGFVIFWRKDFDAKAAHKMLVKLTPGACTIKLFTAVIVAVS